MIPIYEPYFTGNEKKYLNSCIDSGWISSQGDFILRFEDLLAKYHNTKHCISTSSCTTAIHLALKCLDIGPGDEVICPALTFIAPANMIVLTGAKLVLVDINPNTLTISPKEIIQKITDKTKAIIVVHQFGHSAHMDELIEITKNNNIKLIEDNAESLGAKYKNKLLGTIGDIATFSFFANKIITTGEGGALITNDDNIANRARMLRDHGMSKIKRYHHLELGYNYRMTNMQAAIGTAQLEKLDEILAIRKKQMDYYYHELGLIERVHLREFEDWTSPVHWLLTLSIEGQKDTKSIIEFMENNGVQVRPMINPVGHAEHFKKQFANEKFAKSDEVSKFSFHLPSATNLTEEKIEIISSLIKKFVISN